MSTPPLITAAQARRTALAAQHLHVPRPDQATGRHLGRVLDRLQVIQVDSVNVLARAHLMPLFSRLGPYPVEALDRRWQTAPRTWTEYWAHEASLVPVGLRPSLVTVQGRTWMTAHRMDERLRAQITDQVLETLAGSRPLTARQVEQRVEAGHRTSGHWGWNWSDVKRVLEDLFVEGSVVSAGRTPQFERRYTLAHRALPAAAGAAPADRPDPDEAVLTLVRAAAPALGVSTLASLADYYRLRQDRVRAAVGVLESTGELERVRLRTWTGAEKPAWCHAGARTPRRVHGRALLSPFDPQVFHRPRVQELFGVRYRIGIYTPEPQRTRGYYPLLFLLGEHLVAQVDLAAQRREGVLSVRGAWSEDQGPDGGVVPPAQVARELVAELGELARWLGLERIAVAPQAPGELASPVARELQRAPSEQTVD